MLNCIPINGLTETKKQKEKLKMDWNKVNGLFGVKKELFSKK
jgi:hypothetical protein